MTGKLVGLTGLSFVQDKTHGLWRGWTAVAQNSLGTTHSPAGGTMKEGTCPTLPGQRRHGAELRWGGCYGNAGLWELAGFLTHRHNYLLGYSLAERFALSPFLRPLVTRCYIGDTRVHSSSTCVRRGCILEPEDAQWFHPPNKHSVKLDQVKMGFWWTGS